MWKLHPEVLDNYDISDKAYVAVLDLPMVISKCDFDIKYENLGRFPAMSRDISIVMDKKIMVGEVEAVIRKKGGKLLESFHLFDVYEGTQVGENKKSVAYSITFRAKDRTLEDKEVAEVMDKILKELSNMGIELRQ